MAKCKASADLIERISSEALTSTAVIHLHLPAIRESDPQHVRYIHQVFSDKFNETGRVGFSKIKKLTVFAERLQMFFFITLNIPLNTLFKTFNEHFPPCPLPIL